MSQLMISLSYRRKGAFYLVEIRMPSYEGTYLRIHIFRLTVTFYMGLVVPLTDA